MRYSVEVQGSEVQKSESTTLRQRLDRYDLDDPNSRLKFSERLARENNWTFRYARRVVVEYKRFLELAVVAGHTVTPSDDVDQAWHLHMVYTHSYWNDLCKNVLQQPLHHGPTKGGQEERERYEDLYAKTLESYFRIFGEEPPADIWPDSEERFRQSIQSIRIDKGKNWVIPKPQWAQVARAGAYASAFASFPLLLGVSDLLLGAGPFIIDGKTFLVLYVVMFVIAMLISLLIRSNLRPSPRLGEMPPAADKVGWAASAVLAGGYNRAVLAAIAKLRSEGRIGFVKNRLVSSAHVPNGFTKDADPVGWSPEAAIPTVTSREITETKDDIKLIEKIEYLVREKKKGIKLDELTRSLREDLNHTTIKLEQLELWSSSGERLARGLATAGPIGLLMLIGLARCFIGVTRDRPVGILVVFLIASGVVGLILLSSFPRRTRLGDLFVDQLKERFPAPSATLTRFSGSQKKFKDSDSQETMSESPYLMGLYGAAMFSQCAVGDDVAFYNSLKSQAGSMPGGDGGSFVSGGCGGDGGGGCGGGCGGCGGCGG